MLSSVKLGRNEPCHCGSGKKYKKCCLARDEADSAARAPVSAFSHRRIEDEIGGAAAALDRKVKRNDPGEMEAVVQHLAFLFSEGPLSDIRFDQERFEELIAAELASSDDTGDVEANRQRLFEAAEPRLATKAFCRNVRNRLNEVLGAPESSAEDREAALLGLAGAESGGPIAQIVFELQLDEMTEVPKPASTDLLLHAAVTQVAESIEAASGAPVVDAVKAISSEDAPAIFTADEFFLAAALITGLQSDADGNAESVPPVPPETEIKALVTHLIERLTVRLRGLLAKVESDPGWIERVRARVLRDALEAPSGDPIAGTLHVIGEALPVAGGILVLANLLSPDFLVRWRDDAEFDAFGTTTLDALLQGSGLAELLNEYATHLENVGEREALSNVHRAQALLGKAPLPVP